MNGIGPEGSPQMLAELQDLVARSPGDRAGWHNLGVELRRLDRSAEAITAFDRATGLGLRAPETETMRGHVLADLGRFDEAIRAYRRAVARQPAAIEAQTALSALLPQMGRTEEALAGFADALVRSPQVGALWVAALEAAKGQGEWGQLLAWADAAQARFGADTMITVFAANALSALGRDAEAFDRLSPALQAEPDYAPGHTTMAHLLIRLGEYGQAAQAAGTATRLAPQDQSVWALLGVILRLLGDEREHWLCDYDRLVLELDLPLDPGLAQALSARHFAQAHPADQSLRGGTQTRGNLFASADPAILALARDIAGAVSARLEELPADPTHPFLADFVGAWSVRLASSGFHVSHMHPAGWLSSALYVALPDSVRAGTGEGALTFGVPDGALGLDLSPRRVVHPREGLLVLFPSYFWHGTTPFSADSARLTLAFDALPSGA
jgi:tetratricopeptide (TPR) repeat protein